MSTLKPMSVFDLCDDIMELILIELLPRQRYNQVVREYKDPREVKVQEQAQARQDRGAHEALKCAENFLRI